MCWRFQISILTIGMTGRRGSMIGTGNSGQGSSRVPHTTDFPQMLVNSKGNPEIPGYFMEI